MTGDHRRPALARLVTGLVPTGGPPVGGRLHRAVALEVQRNDRRRDADRRDGDAPRSGGVAVEDVDELSAASVMTCAGRGRLLRSERRGRERAAGARLGRAVIAREHEQRHPEQGDPDAHEQRRRRQ